MTERLSTRARRRQNRRRLHADATCASRSAVQVGAGGLQPPQVHTDPLVVTLALLPPGARHTHNSVIAPHRVDDVVAGRRRSPMKGGDGPATTCRPS